MKHVTHPFWELPSSSGRETCRWTVTRTSGRGAEATYTCDVTLEGGFYGETLEPGHETDDPDFSLVIHGLQLRHEELQRLTGQIRDWLTLPPAESRTRRLEFSCEMGGLFDQSLRLSLGPRDDRLSGGRPIATIDFLVGRMRGELAYPTDQSCLRLMAEGIERVLAGDSS